MANKLFGTDGIRGRANSEPMTAEIALRLGAAAGRYFRSDGNKHRVVIGKDTRLSGYMLENALTAGLTSTGMNVLLLGPIPTPAVGLLTRSMRADLGVMISASHNPHHDNGIKLVGPDGYKLTAETERAIEDLVSGDTSAAPPEEIGRAKRIDDASGRYEEYVKTTFPGGGSLRGMKVVVDCANGAAYRAAPNVLWELGAEVVEVGVEPDGFNINEGCGSTSVGLAAKTVVESTAHAGICLDGDGDRVIMLDEKGESADGDQLLALLAQSWAEGGRLKSRHLVATQMSNLGLDRHMASKGISLSRTKVGDREVVEAMRRKGCNLGGEQSGHIVMTDYVTTGDGLIAALQALGIMAQTGKRASEVLRVFEPVPQALRNIKCASGRNPLEEAEVKRKIGEAQQELGEKGRLLVRRSGTEPLVRVMVESDDSALMDRVLEEVASVIQSHA